MPAKRTSQKWFKVYVKKGDQYRPNPGLKITAPGIYFIKNTAGEIVYIGYSSYNTEKTLFRHFQDWNDRQQERITYDGRRNYKARIISSTAARAAAVEKMLILKHRPKDNPMKYKAYKFSDHEKRTIKTVLKEQKKDFTGIDTTDPF